MVSPQDTPNSVENGDHGEGTNPQHGDGQALVGRKIRKKFGRKFYIGTISEFETDTNWYKVTYDDGDSEELEWPELEPLLVSEEAATAKKQTRPAASAPKSRKKRKENSKEEETGLIDLNTTTQDASRDGEHGQASDGEVVEAEENQGTVDNVEADAGFVEDAAPVVEASAEEPKESSPAKQKGRKAKKKNKAAAASKAKKASSPKMQQTQAEKKRKAASTPVSASKKPKTTKATAAKATSITTAQAAATPRTRKTPAKAGKTPAKGKQAQEHFSPQSLGVKLKGRKIRKEFDGTLYDGEITSYSRQKRFYKIHYEDGDEEEMEWKEVEPLLLPVDEQESSEAGTSEQQQPTVVRTTVKVLTANVVTHRPATRSIARGRTRRPTTPAS